MHRRSLGQGGDITTKEITFSHSGKIGDILAGLPTVRAFGGGKLLLRPTFEFSEEAIQSVLPLLNSQDYCTAERSDAKADVNLDLFRMCAIPLTTGHLARLYWFVHQKPFDLTKPWLKVKPNKEYSDAIVVGRSLRYQNSLVSYRFLQSKDFERVVFIGTKSEAVMFHAHVRRAKWIETKDMLEAAQIIAGSKLYIGNQSGLWWTAEALKVKRILETYQVCPNSAPHGPDGYDILYSPHLEALTRSLYGT